MQSAPMIFMSIRSSSSGVLPFLKSNVIKTDEFPMLYMYYSRSCSSIDNYYFCCVCQISAWNYPDAPINQINRYCYYLFPNCIAWCIYKSCSVATPDSHAPKKLQSFQFTTQYDTAQKEADLAFFLIVHYWWQHGGTNII